tara:strand:- start:687 stop:947 length:261 start_codon:yes stop_codon:yes gene_type:complete
MKKIIFLLFASVFLSGCFQVVALVGPAVTGATTGNIYQSAISYSVSYGVKKATGKSIMENVLDAAKDKEKAAKNKKNGDLIYSFRP